jgi:hypothetical protein
VAVAAADNELLRLAEPVALGVALSDRDAVDDVDADAPKLSDDVGEAVELPGEDAVDDTEEEPVTLALPV